MAWDKDIPAASTSLRLSNPELLANQAAVEDAMGRDHDFPGTEGSTAGQHIVVQLQEGSSDPDPGADIIAVYNNANALFAQLESTGRVINLETAHVELAKTGDYDVALTDYNTLLTVTGTTTITLALAATLGDGFHIYIKNIGTATVTIDTNSSQTIDGATSITLDAQWDVVHIVCDGSNFNLATWPRTGTVLQVVSTQDGDVATGTTTIPRDNTIPQITEGTEFMTLAITPNNTANLLKIDVVIALSFNVTNGTLLSALFQDTTSNALAAFEQIMGLVNRVAGLQYTHVMTAGTTSSTTFRVRGGSNSTGTTTFNGASSSRLYGGVMASSIVITEYAA